MIGGLYFGEYYLGGFPSIRGTYAAPAGPGESGTFAKLSGIVRNKPTLTGVENKKTNLTGVVSNKPTGIVSSN